MNLWVEFCTNTYWSMRFPQLDRLEAWAVGYKTEERLFYSEVEAQILFGDVLISCSREWWARL